MKKNINDDLESPFDSLPVTIHSKDGKIIGKLPLGIIEQINRSNEYRTENDFMLVKPIFQPYFKPKKNIINVNCFVLMPFKDDLTNWYEDIIKPTIEELNIKTQRADDIFRTGMVIDEIWTSINECDFLIADLTGANPNVYYELGIAHTIGKQVILITQDEKAPFDITHMRYIKYNTSYSRVETFKKQLSDSVKSIISLYGK